MSVLSVSYLGSGMEDLGQEQRGLDLVWHQNGLIMETRSSEPAYLFICLVWFIREI